MEINGQDYDCAVCLQKCHHPTQLPCGHVFCFLCVKGIAIQSKKCAMCRAVIPSDYLDHPVLLEKLSLQETATENMNEENQWYYEGRNGWWKYDERSNNELETALNAGEAGCSLLLAGAVYTIDFQSMIQVRRSDPTRRRKVRRDTPTLPAKGIAGIKIEGDRQIERAKSNTEQSTDDNFITTGDTESEEIIEITDADDETASDSFNSSSSVDLISLFSSINFADSYSSRDFPPTEDT